MEVIADLHLHSKYARATSKNISLSNLAKYGKMKGLEVIGTGDAQHPKWFEELSKELLPCDGLYEAHGMKFMLTTEISLMYSDKGKGRRVHLILLLPSLEVVSQLQECLLKRGRLDYDGRPIFKIPCSEFVELIRGISTDIEVIPAHVWTPWFSLYGSMSGYNSIKDCFEEQLKHIHAVETGLSSDPEMNWRLKELDDKAILSFSDAHSHWPWKLGREATVFDVKRLGYNEIIQAIKNNAVVKTIEFFPEEGKYHFDGHRNCNVVLHPADAIKNNNICPSCRKQLTIGVAHRVEELATRKEGKGSNARPFVKLIPLSELVSASIGSPVQSRKVWEVYSKLIEMFGSELKVLLDSDEKQISTINEKLAELIVKSKTQKIQWKPGYDGVYGSPLFDGLAINKTVDNAMMEEQASVKPPQPSLQKQLAEY